MKYLKKYKIFESTNIDNIEDILLEISDLGYTWEIKHTYNRLSPNHKETPRNALSTLVNEDDVIINIGKFSTDFLGDLKKLSDSILRINSYLESEGFEVEGDATKNFLIWLDAVVDSSGDKHWNDLLPRFTRLMDLDRLLLSIKYVKK